MEQMEKKLLQTVADISGFMPGSAFSLRKTELVLSVILQSMLKFWLKQISQALILLWMLIPEGKAFIFR